MHPEEKRIKYIAVDDNMVDLLLLEEYAREHPSLLLLGKYSSPADAIAAMENIQPDLVFLDVEMPGLNGLDLLRQLKNKIPLAVFITSHPEFALDGFELSALDYILKPITAERFSVAVSRIEDYWQMKQQSDAYEVLFEREVLTIKEGYNQVKLPLHEIIYLEAMQDYTKVVTEKKNYLTLATLSRFMEKLSIEKFLRIHRSYAVALSKVTELMGNKINCGGTILPVGKTYRSTINSIKI